MKLEKNDFFFSYGHGSTGYTSKKKKSVLPTTSQYIKQLIPGGKNITMKGRKINLTHTKKLQE